MLMGALVAILALVAVGCGDDDEEEGKQVFDVRRKRTHRCAWLGRIYIVI